MLNSWHVINEDAKLIDIRNHLMAHQERVLIAQGELKMKDGNGQALLVRNEKPKRSGACFYCKKYGQAAAFLAQLAR